MMYCISQSYQHLWLYMFCRSGGGSVLSNVSKSIIHNILLFTHLLSSVRRQVVSATTSSGRRGERPLIVTIKQNCFLGAYLNHNTSDWLVAYRHVQEHLWFGHGCACVAKSSQQESNRATQSWGLTYDGCTCTADMGGACSCIMWLLARAVR